MSAPDGGVAVGGAGMRAVILVGPMGAGKSEVGRALARRLGWPFVDTDAEIETREQRSIATIFRESGEPYFREVERAVLRDVARGTPTVIATGGGVVLSSTSRQLLQRVGSVFYLRAPLDVLLERVGDDPGRPLLGDDPHAALRRLHDERARFYEQVGTPVDAAQPIDSVVDAILTHLAEARQRVGVGVRTQPYDIWIGSGALALIGFDLRRLGARGRVGIVTDSRLARRFGGSVRAVLEEGGFTAQVIAVPPGERAKSMRGASTVIDALAAFGLSRQDTVAALGGGVIGDLAGFVAGTYMRGVRLVQLPTTLLAQIDSSIGGKTAVNHPRAKNLIGLFHQPALVVADIDTLRSLPARERRAGMAEVVKYAMVLDHGLFEMLEREHATPSRTWSPPQLTQVVARCAALKARVVEEDEFERGPREVLNYGHTVGHAVEVAARGRHVHGEAVAIGMRVEGQIARRVGLLSGDDAYRQDALLEMLGLPAFVPGGTVEPLLDAMHLDKKARDGRIRCTLPEGIGRARLGVEVSDALMREVVVACQESA